MTIESPVETRHAPVMTPDQITKARQRPTIHQVWPATESPMKGDKDSSESMTVAVWLMDGQHTDGFYDDHQQCWYVNDIPTGHVLPVANSELDSWRY